MKEVGYTYIDHDGSIKNNLIMSSIYSKLIKICAKDTLSFNSDLFIDYIFIDNFVKNISTWKNHSSYHKNDEYEYMVYTLAFRDSGVDSDILVNKRGNYNSIWNLTLKHFFNLKKVEASLDEVDLTET